MRRKLMTFLVLILLGAIINITVAWSIGLSINPRSFDGVETSGGNWNGAGYKRLHVHKKSALKAVRIVSRWWDENAGGGSSGGLPDGPPEPLIPSWANELTPSCWPAQQMQNYALAWEYGWPLRSLGGVVVVRKQPGIFGGKTEIKRFFALPLEPELLDDPNTHWNLRLLVFEPLWPGFAINTIFYAGILWLIICCPFILRRRIRHRRGLCVQCAYDLRGADHDRCPECGLGLGS